MMKPMLSNLLYLIDRNLSMAQLLRAGYTHTQILSAIESCEQKQYVRVDEARKKLQLTDSGKEYLRANPPKHQKHTFAKNQSTTLEVTKRAVEKKIYIPKNPSKFIK